MRGVKGEGCSRLPRILDNKDAGGVRPQAMRYHRLSQRVNNTTKWKPY